jgi:hypothetical protein
MRNSVCLEKSLWWTSGAERLILSTFICQGPDRTGEVAASAGITFQTDIFSWFGACAAIVQPQCLVTSQNFRISGATRTQNFSITESDEMRTDVSLIKPNPADRRTGLAGHNL